MVLQTENTVTTERLTVKSDHVWKWLVEPYMFESDS